MSDETVRESFVPVNGIRLHVREAGQGPVVLLLHGFPDYSASWHAQLSALANAGYRAVAPDLRGYAESERPEGVEAYRLTVLSADVAALAAHYGAPVHVVAHDWGGVIAWAVAMHHPEVVRSLTILNAPHPLAYRRELQRGWAQRRRSWYALAFQVPVLPELALHAARRVFLGRLLRSGGHEGDALATALDAYARTFGSVAAWRAAINYYRALVRFRPERATTVHAPTQLIWGMRDPFLGPQLTEGLERWVPNLRVHRVDDAGHWVQWSHAGVVNARLLDFLANETT